MGRSVLNKTHNNVRFTAGLAVAGVLFFVAPAQARSLSSTEIKKIETEFGIRLTRDEIRKLSSLVDPKSAAQWRTDAYQRIGEHRRVDLNIQVLDEQGLPADSAKIRVVLKRNQFKFGGALSAKSFSIGTDGMSSDAYKSRALSMFNSIGANNDFKPRLPLGHAYLPGLMSWAEENNMPVRGHLLLWPGNGNLSDLDDPSKVPGKDYGSHLSHSRGSDYASYDVMGAVELYKNSARAQGDKDALKAEVNAEIAEWAGRWNVYEWDVLNETVDNHLLQDILGNDQMAEWFKIAESNVVSPDCKLVINDYQIITGISEELRPGYYTDRRDRYRANIDRILAEGGRIDRIGFQSRVRFERRDPQLIYDRLEEWGERYGLEMVGTEFEVADTDGDWYPYTYTEQERAQITEEMLTLYFSHPLVTGLTVWNGISNQKTSLLDNRGRPTLHGLIWYYLHRIRFSTDRYITTGENGKISLRAFKGEYEITVRHKDQDTVVTKEIIADQNVVINL